MSESATLVGQGLRDLHQQIAMLQAEFARQLAEFDAAQGYELDHYGSTQAWLRGELRMAPTEAAQQVRAARRLRQLPEVEKAFACGEISAAHVAVISRSCARLDVGKLAAAESVVVDQARTSNPRDLRNFLTDLAYRVDPDKAERQFRETRERRYFSIAPILDGWNAVDGLLDSVDADRVTTTLDAVMGPPVQDDTRDAGQRRADALVELCRWYLDSGLLSTNTGSGFRDLAR